MKTKTIEGDLIQIQIYGKNKIALIILTDVIGAEKFYTRVEVDDDNWNHFIRENLMPMTHIKLEVYDDGILHSRFDACKFDNNSQIEYSKEVKYGHYICPLCGYDHGTNKSWEGKYCMICGCKESQLEYVTDFYK